jgi:hypothetical protein
MRRSSPGVGLRIALVVVLVPLAIGCFTVNGASSSAIPAVKIQASTDLDCPQSELRVIKDLTGHFHVVGCGRTVEYSALCNGSVGSPGEGRPDGFRCVAAPEGQSVPWAARPDPIQNP